MRLMLLCLLSFMTSLVSAEPLIIKGASISEAPPNATVMAGYMTLRNENNETITIKAFKSLDFEKVELHETKIVNDTASMVPVDKIDIAPQSEVILKPGGLHIMLIKPKKRFLYGDIIQLEIIQADSTRHILNIPVEKMGATTEEHHHHKHHH